MYIFNIKPNTYFKRINMNTTFIHIFIIGIGMVIICSGKSSVEMTKLKKYPIDNVKLNTYFQVTSVSSRGDCLMACKQTSGCICVSFNTLSSTDNCAISDNSLITGNTELVTGWNVFYDTVAYARANHCTTGWTIYGNSCYKLEETPLNYLDAAALCEKHPNGHLVDISSFGENMVVSNIVNARYPLNSVTYEQYVFCGLNDIVSAGIHKWSDGSTLTSQSYNRWNEDQPDNSGNNEACVHLIPGDNMYWNDISCSSQFISVCEMDITV